MNFEVPQFMLALPEIFLLGMICTILILDLFFSDEQRTVTYLLTQATIIITALLSLNSWGDARELTFSGLFVLDPMATLLKLAIYSAVFITFLYSRRYLLERDMYRGEFYILGLSAMLGMMVMVSANSFLTIYLGLELLSLSLYAMVAMQRDSVTASEAAMKYFILGAMASAMLLYGMSMIYGATGTLDLSEMNRILSEGGHDSLVLIFGLVFLLVGVAFKLGAVPFHMWVPDVYHVHRPLLPNLLAPRLNWPHLRC